MGFVYKVLPYFIIRTNWFMPEWAYGVTYWMFVLVKKDVDLSTATLEHELVHVRQQYRYTPLLFDLLYFGSDRWRLKFEVEAYKKNIQHGDSPERIAESLFRQYDIDEVGRAEIIRQLKE